MTEVPEHLLQRSRDRRRAMGLAVDGDDAPVAATTATDTPVAAASAPAINAPVPIPAAQAPAPVEPTSEWVTAALERQKIPYWVMPVLIFLPVWLIMYVGTLEEPARQAGVLYEGSVVYETECATCHGATGGGGIGPAFNDGAIIETFAGPEAHIGWVAQGTQVFINAGRQTYGDSETALAATGALMPAFGDKLTAEEIIAAAFYERIELGGHEEDLPLAEALWAKLEHGDLDGTQHLVEGIDGDLDGTGEIADFFRLVYQELAGGEVAHG